MKTNFKHAIIAATALLLGFSSCSNDDANAPADDLPTQSVSVRILVPSTYAPEATAVGVTPTITGNTNVFFVGGGVILEVGTLNAAEAAAGKTFTDVPGAVSDVIIVANGGTVATSPALSTIVRNDPLSKLNETLFLQASQTNAQTAVNLFGRAPLTDGAGVNAGKKVAAVTLVPAISRIEIGEIKADAGAAVKLKSFKLTGIYINNTYTQLGIDYVTKPTLATEILNYDKANAKWIDGNYPARFKDEWANASVTDATSFKPAGTDKWSYFVLPVKASANGTEISSVQQGAVPHIVFKIEDIDYDDAAYQDVAGPYFITIKNLKVGGADLTELAPGKVYSLNGGVAGDPILIGGGNLSPDPETNATEEVVVSATVTPWEGFDVDPVF
ncbi:hypothetical protein [Dysgonomonas termitidis]|uniref:Major fimbrial subunit protein N-terminal domain-containing protein n=1 Tax=Dysgonomonas termitidis TaxID=1516126 RepID=A0ABV9L5A1_9BACT